MCERGLIPSTKATEQYENAIKRARGKIPESKAEPEQETTIRQKLPPVFRAQFPRVTSMVDCFQSASMLGL